MAFATPYRADPASSGASGDTLTAQAAEMARATAALIRRGANAAVTLTLDLADAEMLELLASAATSRVVGQNPGGTDGGL
jgi:hypothetical protein